MATSSPSRTLVSSPFSQSMDLPLTSTIMSSARAPPLNILLPRPGCLSESRARSSRNVVSPPTSTCSTSWPVISDMEAMYLTLMGMDQFWISIY